MKGEKIEGTFVFHRHIEIHLFVGYTKEKQLNEVIN